MKNRLIKYVLEMLAFIIVVILLYFFYPRPVIDNLISFYKKVLLSSYPEMIVFKEVSSDNKRVNKKYNQQLLNYFSTCEVINNDTELISSNLIAQLQIKIENSSMIWKVLIYRNNNNVIMKFIGEQEYDSTNKYIFCIKDNYENYFMELGKYIKLSIE